VNGLIRMLWLRNVVKQTIFPIVTVWVREPAMLVMFCSVNLLVAQAGILFAFWYAAEKGGVGHVLSRQLQSANLYVFAVSLLVTTSSILVAEYLEAEADNKKIELRGHKVFWGIVALILVIFQSMVTGRLIPDSLAPDSAQSAAPSTTIVGVLSTWGGAHQVVLWCVSMFIAVYLYCLSRMHRHPQELHLMRERVIQRAAAKAEKLRETSDHEKI
jgi:CBS domain containing-hemolysin-like protein